jgi:hypothetical protein
MSESKYYIDGKEVTKGEYDILDSKLTRSEDFEDEQMPQMTEDGFGPSPGHASRSKMQYLI